MMNKALALTNGADVINNVWKNYGKDSFMH